MAPRRVAERDLRERDDEVQEQHADEDAPETAGVAVGGWRRHAAQKTRAVGTGHQRSCTLPMMYFFGTMPQWRLSELLFRWSPITK